MWEWAGAAPLSGAARRRLVAGCHRLGGGMASRLFQELREERGLCYSIYSFYWPFTDTGLFGIQTATSEEDVEELVPVVVSELRKMTDGVTVEVTNTGGRAGRVGDPARARAGCRGIGFVRPRCAQR